MIRTLRHIHLASAEAAQSHPGLQAEMRLLRDGTGKVGKLLYPADQEGRR